MDIYQTQNRELEKFRLRQSRREELVRAFLVIDEILLLTSGKIVGDDDHDFTKHWIKLSSLMHLYGSEEQNQELKRFAEAFLGQNRNIADANSSRNSLRTTLINSTRLDLGF